MAAGHLSLIDPLRTLVNVGYRERFHSLFPLIL
jgi:hypothetical protein